MSAFKIEAYADEILYDLAANYTERGGRVWHGAVELTPEQCQAELADLVSCAEWAQFQQLMADTDA